MTTEALAIRIPPALKHWLETVVQRRKAHGDRQASLTSVVIEILEDKAKATSNYPLLQ